MKKHKKNAGSFIVGLVALAAAAVAQPGVVEVASGLPHTSLGGALIGPADGRRLPVRNLGSSGEDGVEVQLRSLFGGGVAIDSGGFLATAGGEIKIKHKGWDGLIYHRHSARSNGDGTGSDTFDFSPLGVSSFQVTDYDSNGHPISSTTIDGPVGEIDWLGQVIQCAPPSYWVTYGGWFMVNGKPHYVTWRRCVTLASDPTGGGYDYARVVSPIFLPGAEPFGLDSIEVSSNLPEFTVVASELATFGAASNGLGQAHISEQCASSTGVCTPDERKLVVNNIGSSGHDGVAIDLPDNGGVQWRRRDTCCPSPGHTTLTRLIDDTGHEIATLTESPNGSLTEQNVTCDFSALGVSGVGVRCLDENGVQIAYLEYPLTTTITVASPKCPPGMYWGLRNPPNLGWGCMHYMDLVLPGGTTVPGTFMVEFVALGLSRAPQARTIETTTSGVSEFAIEQMTTLPTPCPADVDDGSGTGSPDGGVTIDDLLYYLFIFEAGDLAADVDDGSGSGTLDGGVTIDDLLYYLFRFESGC